MRNTIIYSTEPADKGAYTKGLDKAYGLISRPYDIAVKLLPVWKTWLKQAVPHIRGPRVLEVSFGTGFLLTQYADDFDGYPDGQRAMSELHRVLKPGGRLVLIDIAYPADGNHRGLVLMRLWLALGDLVRDLGELFHEAGFDFTEEEIGGFGTVHLYVAHKAA